MATLELPDDLLEALTLDARKRGLRSSPAQLVSELVLGHLRERCAPGFDRDGLTGARSRAAFRARIDDALFGEGWSDESVLRLRLLVVDVDRLNVFNADHDHAAGDRLLVGLARGLAERYGEGDVHRVGGDDFVVVLGDRQAWVPPAPAGASFEHALVDVEVRRRRGERALLHAWIELHLFEARRLATVDGAFLACTDPVLPTFDAAGERR